MKGYGFRFRTREWRWKLAGHHRRHLGPAFTEPLEGATALEIGGPSAEFGKGGRLPVYELVDTVDGCNFAAETVWTRHGDQPPGRLMILEATELEPIADAAYDAVLASHVLEHVANPLRALGEWRRVVRPGGALLLVLPHKEGTFDHRRPVTPLEHMIEDQRREIGEDDETHLAEVLELHDLGRDPELENRDALARRLQDNLSQRTVHHHVFTTRTALELLDHAGLEIRAVEPRWRHDIFVLCRVPAAGERPDNGPHLAADAAWLRKSPFRADRGPR
jgi:SAM-dependent methyltransferase